MMVCTDTVCNCGNCRAVDYDKMRKRREAAERRANGGRGRPPWWHGIGLDPDSRPSEGGRMTPPLSSHYT